MIMYAVLLLLSAIGLEVGATASLPRTRGFHDPTWSLAVVAGYAISIWLLSLVVRTLPVSIAYAIWSGVGTAVVAAIGCLWLGESMSWLKVVCLGMIVAGVVGLNLAGGAHA
ncbi:DMT family transporter [Nocardioides sp. AN3]